MTVVRALALILLPASLGCAALSDTDPASVPPPDPVLESLARIPPGRMVRLTTADGRFVVGRLLDRDARTLDLDVDDAGTRVVFPLADVRAVMDLGIVRDPHPERYGGP